MSRPFPACVAALALAGAAAAWAQSPSFDLVIQAPDGPRELLERHLELGRYREVPDLDEAELARLRVLAERDARQLLGTLGFFNPLIAFDIDNTARPPRVTLRVDPGAQARIAGASIDFEGDIADRDDPGPVAQREAIRGGWRLTPGQPFTQAAWDAAKTRATRTLQARRYPRGRIADSLADIDASTGQARLGLKLDSGPAFRLGPLQVSGLSRYDPRLVPRLARLPEGSEYDQERLLEAQLRLAGSGWFDSAFVYVDPDSDPQAAPVQVTLREAPLQRVVGGVGVSTDRGPRLSLEYRHNRVPGLGWRADTRLQLERQAPSAETEWTGLPDERGWRWGVLGRVEQVRDTGGQTTRAQRVRVGRSLTGEAIDRDGYVQFDRANVTDATGQALPEDTGDGTSLAFNYVWTRRGFDRALNPTRGDGLAVEVGAGLTLVGSKQPFQRTLVRWLRLLPLEGSRLQLRAEAGAVLARGFARVPSTQLFRTGGDTTVRGYGYRAIGIPLAAGGEGPGRYLAVASVEWLRPWRGEDGVTPWEQAFFIDAGAVTDRPAAFQPQVGVGTGLRYASPIGPLRLDLAWAVQPRRLRLHLSVGATF